MNRLIFIFPLLLIGCGTEKEKPPAHLILTEAQARPLTDRAFDVTPARLARGKYLAEGVLRCFFCHSEANHDLPGSPPMEGMTGAGVVWWDRDSTRLVAPNLTPDNETGIGRWADDMLARAIREGVGHDGRVLSTSMNYGSFRRLTDEDLAAVIVYLRSLPPIHNPLPQTILSLDEQARLASRLSPLTGPVPERDLSDPVERGRYLVLVGSCVGCHTSWYSSRNPGLLGGGNIIERGEQKYFSTNITAHPSGMPYNAEAFINVIRTGKGGTLGPAMPWWTYQHMTDEDLGAIHAFMQTMNPIAHYINNFVEPTWCTVCGQEHGLGDRNRIEMPTSVAVDLALFDDYVGAYRSEEYGFTIRVRREGDHLRAQEDEGPVVDLIPQSDTRFLMPGGIAPLRFVRDEDGQVTRLVSEEVEEIVLQRIE
ncbi:MAG: c-type cytochrome [Actinobacteria bacterium]|nr:c-type cytochrome [Actinomycetota bacterium]